MTALRGRACSTPSRVESLTPAAALASAPATIGAARSPWLDRPAWRSAFEIGAVGGLPRRAPAGQKPMALQKHCSSVLVLWCTLLSGRRGSTMMAGARVLEVQQHYYVTRVSEPHVPQHPNEGACTSGYPQPYCPTGNDVTLDMFNWTSAEIKAGISTPTGVVAAYDCVAYAVCGFRIYDAGDLIATQPFFSDPEQFLVVRSSTPLLQQPNSTHPQRCRGYPDAELLCPAGRERRSVYNITSQEVVGLALSQAGGVLGQFECATYAICGYRIFDPMPSDTSISSSVERRRVQSPVAQQFLAVRTSTPLILAPGEPATCVKWPSPVDCQQMHFYLSQTTTNSSELKATVTATTLPATVVGLFNCVTESLCGYANPPPLAQITGV